MTFWEQHFYRGVSGHHIHIHKNFRSMNLAGVEGSLAHLENSSLKQNLAHLDEVAAAAHTRDASAQKHHLENHLAHREDMDGKVEDKQGFRVPFPREESKMEQGFRVPFHLPTLIGQPPASSPLHAKYEDEEMVH